MIVIDQMKFILDWPEALNDDWENWYYLSIKQASFIAKMCPCREALLPVIELANYFGVDLIDMAVRFG